MKSGKSNPVFRYDHKRTWQSIRMIFQQSLDHSYLVSDPLIVQSQQYHTSMRPLFTEDFLTEIFVAGNDDPVLRKGFLENLLIIDAARRLVNGKHLMALAAQPTSQRRTNIFIDEKAHYASTASGITAV